MVKNKKGVIHIEFELIVLNCTCAFQRIFSRPRYNLGMTFTINIVTSGCTHRELDALHKTVEEFKAESGKKVDLVIYRGDF
uniref:Glycogen(starch) synthase n=1 Tax=Strongyloides papillosus TaxID=174720 RepID=A0A0N5BTW5_STREA